MIDKESFNDSISSLLEQELIDVKGNSVAITNKGIKYLESLEKEKTDLMVLVKLDNYIQEKVKNGRKNSSK